MTGDITDELQDAPVWVDEAPGGGAAFHVELPIGPDVVTPADRTGASQDEALRL